MGWVIVKAFTGNKCESRSDKHLIIFDKDENFAKDISEEMEKRGIFLPYNVKIDNTFRVAIRAKKIKVIWDNQARDVKRIVDAIKDNY